MSDLFIFLSPNTTVPCSYITRVPILFLSLVFSKYIFYSFSSISPDLWFNFLPSSCSLFFPLCRFMLGIVMLNCPKSFRSLMFTHHPLLNLDFL